MASETNNSRLTTPKARRGSPNNVCHKDDHVFLDDCTQLLQGHTQDQPGPRKKVPIAVSTANSIRNHVMIQ